MLYKEGKGIMDLHLTNERENVSVNEGFFFVDAFFIVVFLRVIVIALFFDDNNCKFYNLQ